MNKLENKWKLLFENTLNKSLIDLKKHDKQPLECYDVQIIDYKDTNKIAFANTGLDKQDDLLYIKFKLAHEGFNKNKDGFKSDDLKSSAKSAVLKGLNWEHGEPVIGIIYSSEFIDSKNESNGVSKGEKGKDHVVCEAAVWKFRYPELARKMIKRYSQGTLSFSMETYYGGVECSKCGEYFDSDAHSEGQYCEHLNTRFDKSNSDTEFVGRYLRKITFAGAGVVEDPADVSAEALALAKNNERKEVAELSDTKKIEMTEAELASYVEKEVEKRLAEASNSKEFEAAKKELDEAKASVKTLTDELSAVKTSLEEITKERDTVKSEFDTFKSQIESEKSKASRVKALQDVNFKLPEGEEDMQKFMNTVMSMNDDVFQLYVDSVKVEKPEAEATSKSGGNPPATGGFKSKANASTDEKPHEFVGNFIANL